MPPTLWIDVEDLFDYARGHARPSGIQRVAFEIARMLHAAGENVGLDNSELGGFAAVRFVRHDPARNSFRVLKWSQVARLFDGLTEAAPPRRAASSVPAAVAPHPPARRRVRELVYRLPASLRVRVVEALVAQERSFRAWRHLLSAVACGSATVARRGLRRLRAREAVEVGRIEAGAMVEGPGPDVRFSERAAPGDTVLVMGAPWSSPNYATLIATARARLGLRFALLVHDIIPLRRPEWCDAGTVRLFRAFFDEVLPLCDQVFAVSRATAADVAAYARERGVALAAPVAAIPLGTGFGVAAFPAALPTPRPPGLPPAGTYALFVSTIEARKNHLLLFRVWRRLLEELPPDQVPTLVFAGRVGWLVSDLMHQIANTGHLGGKLVVMENPADAELSALYRGCLFTVFPSLYEGWGLPVTESLALGKPCLIADRTSLPEAGGDLARRFDPDNLHDACAAIRETILDPAALARWEERVRREFRPVPWTASAEALLATLGQGSMAGDMAGDMAVAAKGATEAAAEGAATPAGAGA